MRTPSHMHGTYGCVGGMHPRTHIHPHIKMRVLACGCAVLTIGGGQVLR
jgi:hypothetical protein